MTRFARAVGSKGSNDKKPEEATSWGEMKAQMLSKNENKAASKNKCDVEADVDVPTAEEISSVWAELVSESKAEKSMKSKKKKNEAKSKKEDSSETNPLIVKKNKRKLLDLDTGNNKNKKIKTDDGLKKKKNKANNQIECNEAKLGEKKKKKKITASIDDDGSRDKPSLPIKSKNDHLVTKKLKKKNLKSKDKNILQEPPAISKKKKQMIKTEEVNLKDKKTKKKKQKVRSEANIDQSLPTQNKKNTNSIKEVQNSSMEQIGANGLIFAEPKPKEKKRRKEELKASEVLINGKPVQLAPFDGFVVQAEDAQRLKNLRQDMKTKGVPEVERERAIKLERRRAEKALARLKKRVCFHCRGSGHNLSECPQVQDDQRATGICYKCGSTEHTHYQCRVTRSDDYRFAECFICKEQGHISKQCPDNPRGLYPRGGGCASCGDVTHLKKDCPKYLAEKEEETVTIGTRNNEALEALDEDFQVPTTVQSKKPKRHIKF